VVRFLLRRPPRRRRKGLDARQGQRDWESEQLIALARKLQPGIIIDNRTELEQDLWTPEQYQPQEWIRHAETGELVTWEACQTLSGSWATTGRAGLEVAGRC
jgi:hypothetical protein